MWKFSVSCRASGFMPAYSPEREEISFAVCFGMNGHVVAARLVTSDRAMGRLSQNLDI